MTDGELSIDGFSMFRSDRKGRVGGGVLLYIRSSIPVQSLSDVTDIGFEESAWCIPDLGRSTLVIGVCYRSPSNEELNNDRLLHVVVAASNYCNKKTAKSHLLLVGDFNYPEINFSHFMVETNTESSAYKFFNITQDLFLYQYVD